VDHTVEDEVIAVLPDGLEDRRKPKTPGARGGMSGRQKIPNGEITCRDWDILAGPSRCRKVGVAQLLWNRFTRMLRRSMSAS
jgi:hypothetical protein